jgi:hypothetical protein
MTFSYSVLTGNAFPISKKWVPYLIQFQRFHFFLYLRWISQKLCAFMFNIIKLKLFFHRNNSIHGNKCNENRAKKHLIFSIIKDWKGCKDSQLFVVLIDWENISEKLWCEHFLANNLRFTDDRQKKSLFSSIILIQCIGLEKTFFSAKTNNNI